MRRMFSLPFSLSRLPMAVAALAASAALAQAPVGDAPPATEAAPATDATPATDALDAGKEKPKADVGNGKGKGGENGNAGGNDTAIEAPAEADSNTPGNADEKPGKSEGAANENGAANANPNAVENAAPLNTGDDKSDNLDTSDIPPPSDTTGIFDTEVEEPTIPKSQWGTKAESDITGMRNKLTNALGALGAAREKKDAVRLNCVNDKITAMKGILRIAEDAYIDLQEALASGIDDKAKYELHKINISRKKMNQLAEEAKNCVGAEATYTGETDVKVNVDGDVVGDGNYYDNPDFFNTGTNVVGGGNTAIGGGEEAIDTIPPLASDVTGN